MTTVRLRTGSQLHRLMNCPASEQLPHHKETIPMAEFGTAIHRYLQLCSTVEPVTALSMVEEDYQDVCSQIDVDRLPIDGIAELAVAYNVVTGAARELGRGLDRDVAYVDVDPLTEIALTIDICKPPDDGAIFLADYKAGWLYPGPASKSAQLGVAFLALSRLWRCHKGQVALIHMPGGGRPRWDVVDVDVFYALQWEQRIRDVWPRLNTPQHDTHGGQWCRYCPALPHCPGQTGLLNRLVTGEEALEIQQAISTGHKAAAYHRIETALSVLNSAKRSLYGHAAQSPIDLGDGRVLGERTKRGRTKIESRLALEVLQAEIGEAAELANEPRITKGSVSAAIATVAAKGQKSALERRVFSALEQAGAMTTPISTVVDVYTSKEDPE